MMKVVPAPQVCEAAVKPPARNHQGRRHAQERAREPGPRWLSRTGIINRPRRKQRRDDGPTRLIEQVDEQWHADGQGQAQSAGLHAAAKRAETEREIQPPQDDAGAKAGQDLSEPSLSRQPGGKPQERSDREVATSAPPGRRRGRLPVITGIQPREQKQLQTSAAVLGITVPEAILKGG